MDAGSILDDLDNGEQLVLLTALPDQTYAPRPRGKKLHKGVPYRWASSGVSGIRLEAMNVGSGLATTKSAVYRFFRKLSDPDAPAEISSPAQQQRNYQAADARTAAVLGV